MVPNAKNVLKYWLRAIEALAAEARADGEQATIVGNIPASSEAILRMGAEYGRAQPAPDITQRKSTFRHDLAKDTPWRPGVIQVLAATFRDDMMEGYPTPVLAVPCEVTVARGQPSFRPPQNSLIPSIPRGVLIADGEDKEGIVMGQADSADEWLRQNGSALETVRHSGSWTGWWNSAMSLLSHVTHQNIDDPLSALGNELTATMMSTGDRHVKLRVNVVDTGSVPSASINLTTTMRQLIETEFLNPKSLTTKLLSGSSSKTDLKLPKLIREAASNIAVMDKYDDKGVRKSLALDPSQRTAVLRHLSGATLSTVTGPPGSGKTASMRAIIGDALARPLLSQAADPAPKMILATGATNKAVTNIIESFAGATSPIEDMNDLPLTSRWVDRVPSYGWFAPSRTVQGRMQQGQGAKKDESISQFDTFMGIGRYCQNPDAESGLRFRNTFLGSAARIAEMYSGMGLTTRLYEAANQYLTAANKHLGVELFQITRQGEAEVGLKKAIAKIREEVKDLAKLQFSVQDALWNMVSTGDRGSHAAQLGHALVQALTQCGPFSKDQNEASDMAMGILKDAYAAPPINSVEGEEASLELFHKVQAALDDGPRLAAFHYASRYWEGRWLISRFERFQTPLEVATELSKLATEKGLTTAIRKDMDDLLYLAPCIVATAHTMPTVFGISGRPEAAFGIADEMIVDEAGQAPQDLIGPVSAFAQRAVFLGDTKQIQPIYALTPERDTALMKSFLISEGLEEGAIPASCRISYGSAMGMAEYASDFTAHTLRYHYRCRPEIITWSNDFCYGGALIPMRARYEMKESDELVPTLGYVRVSGRADSDGKGSKRNIAEASEIANWIFNHKDDIEARFNARLHNSIAILTPYAQQRRLIQSQLSRVFKGVDDVQLRKMVIGTVHQLQGAERPLVLFSTTVTTANTDPASGSLVLFDKAPNLLNVAISRASESFILFGAPKMLDRQDNLPFGSLASFVREHGRRLSPVRREPEVRKPRPGADGDYLSSMSPI